MENNLPMKATLKFALFFSITSLFTESAFAQSCFFAKQMGGYEGNNGMAQDATEQGNAIVLDNNGNVYTTGQFSDTADFDPGAGNYTLIASGANGNGAFVSKLDASGNFVWAVMPVGDAQATDIAIDQIGNIYVSGSFSGSVDFDPGAGTLSAGLSSGGFLWKLDSNGNVIWVKAFAQAAINSIGLASNGDICYSGFFSGTTDFDPGIGTYNITAPNSNEIYLAKISAAGSFLWAFSLGEPMFFDNHDLAIDNNDNIILTGNLLGTLDFDPSGTYMLTSNGFGAFISKYSPSGSFIWAYTYDNLTITSLAVDPSNNIYYGGHFQTTVDIDPGLAVYNLTATTYFDVFVAKLSSSGNFLWAQKEGGVSSELGGPVATDNSGNVYITGYRHPDPLYGAASFDLDPGNGVFTLPINNISFLVKFSSAGNFIFAKSLSQSPSAFDIMIPKGMVLDPINTIYTTGYFKGTLNAQDYDPDPNGSYPLNTIGGANENQIFVCKFPSLTASVSYTDITCFGANNGTATISVPDGNAPFTYSLDSLAPVANNTFSTLGPGSHIIRVSDVNGCTQTAPSFYITEPAELAVTATATQESCVGGGSNGTATAAATGGTPAYDYSWNTTPVQTGSQATGLNAGQYIVTVTDTNSCIDTAHITVPEEYNPSEFTYTVNNMVVSFQITGTGCNSFLWDFGNGNTSGINAAPIVTYATAGTYSACLQCNSQPSSCVTCKNITVPGSPGVGIDTHDKLKEVKIYPNPGNGMLTIESDALEINVIKVVDLLGETLVEIKDSDKTTLDLRALSKGIYIVELQTGSGRHQQKISIQ